MGGNNGTRHVPILTVTLLAVAGLLYAAEHPAEHPRGGEHPTEHPAAKKPAALTKEDLADAIEAYVKKDAALKGGYFLVYDAASKKALVLSLDKVHKDRLSRVGKEVYFACADFRTPAGKVYDLDIFMKGPAKDRLQVTEIAIHKEQGEPRYTWHEEGGIWKKKPVTPPEKAKKEHSKREHPTEHPQ